MKTSTYLSLFFLLILLAGMVRGVESDAKGNFVFVTTQGNYTVNDTTALVTSIIDNSSNMEILNTTSGDGCGLLFNNGTTWYPSTAVSTDKSRAYIHSNTTDKLIMSKNISTFNFTITYESINNHLNIKINMSYLGSGNTSTIFRYMCDLHTDLITNFDIIPADEVNPFSKSKVSNSISIIKEYHQIGSTDNVYIFNDTLGFALNIKEPYANSVRGTVTATNYFRIRQDLGLDLVYEFSKGFFYTNSNSEIEIDLGLNNKYSYAIDDIYNSSYNSSDNIRGAWFLTCGSTSSITDEQLQEAYDKGARFYELNCMLPDQSILPENGSTWTTKYSGGFEYSYEYLDNLSYRAKNIGLSPFVYFIASHINETTAKMYFPYDIATNHSYDHYYDSNTGSLVMSFDNESGWFGNASKQIEYLLRYVPNADGIYLDYNRLRSYDYNSSDPIDSNIYDNEINTSYSSIMNSYTKFLKNISDTIDSYGKKLALNVPTSSIYMEYGDEISADTDTLNDIARLRLLAMNKPFHITPDTGNQSSIFNKSILWGAYLSYSANTARNFTSKQLELSNRAANDRFITFDADSSGNVHYVEYSSTLTSDADSFQYNSSTYKNFYFLNNHTGIANNVTQLNWTQHNDGLTDVILMSEADNCVYLYEDFTVINSYAGSDGEVDVCNEIYNDTSLTDSNANGAIIIGGNNVVLDGNGATLQGNWTAGSKFMDFGGYQNITVKNGKFIGYKEGYIVMNESYFYDVSMNVSNSFNLTENIIWERVNLTFYLDYDEKQEIKLGHGVKSNVIINNSIIKTNDTNRFINIWCAKAYSNLHIENSYIYNVWNYSHVYYPNEPVKRGNFTYINNYMYNSKGWQISGYDDPAHFTFTFENNYFENVYTSISLSRTDVANKFTLIRNNTINCSTYGHFSGKTCYGIYWTDDSDILIENNTVHQYADGYGYDTIKPNDNVTLRYNNLYNHECRDIRGFTFSNNGQGNLTIENNYFEGCLNRSAFNIQNSSNNILRNNIINVTSLEGRTQGYAIQITDHSDNNIIENNSVYGAFAALRLQATDGRNNTFRYNDYTNISGYHVFVNEMNSTSLENNIYDDGFAIYRVQNYFNATINETSSSYHLINLSNLGILKMIGDWRKSATIRNNTVELKDLTHSYSFNQIFLLNGTETPLAENIDSYNVTIPANNRSFVFMYSLSNQPKFLTIGSSVTDISYGLSDVLEVNCTGDGFSAQNLDYLGSTIYVYHDGAYVEMITTPTYEAPSCSRWVFTGSELEYYNTEVKPEFVGAYLTIAGLMSLFVIGLIITSIFLLIQSSGDVISFNDMTFKGLVSFILAMFVIIATVVIVLVFGNAMP